MEPTQQKRKVPWRKQLRRIWETWGIPVVFCVALILHFSFLGSMWAKRIALEESTPFSDITLAAEPLVVIRYATEEEQAERDRQMIEALAQTVWGEARGCSTTEQAAVVWCILNRADNDDFPNDPLMVVQQQGQFDGYNPDYPVEPELVALVEDVLGRWELEDTAVGGVGRVLPKDYLFFEGDGTHNHFRQNYIKIGETWSWSLPSPYEK